MPNTFTNTSWVSMEILRLLLNKLVVAEYFNRSWEKDFQKEFAPGSSITVKFPWQPQAIDGMAYLPQAISRVVTTVPLDQWIQIPFEWDDYERAVKLERSEEELRENYWDPCGAEMAQQIDSRCALFAYQNASQVTGALGTSPTSATGYYAARRILTESACPPGKRGMLISSEMMAAFGGGITTWLNPEDELTRMFKEGSLGRAAGFSFYESNSLYSHTAGVWAGAVTVHTAGQSGTQLHVTAGAGDTFLKGDKISIALVNKVNPKTRRRAGPATEKQFTITQDLVAAGGGAAGDILNILPAIYGPGEAYQNVDALPGHGAALTLWPGTAVPSGAIGTVGLGLSRYAFALVAAKLYVPKAVEQAGQAQDPETGIAVRKVIAWDPRASLQVNRMDSLVGFGNLYQDNGAVCVCGA